MPPSSLLHFFSWHSYSSLKTCMSTYLGSLFSELACSCLAWIFPEHLRSLALFALPWSPLHVVRLFCFFIFHIGDFFWLLYQVPVPLTVSDFSIVFPYIHIIGVDWSWFFLSSLHKTTGRNELYFFPTVVSFSVLFAWLRFTRCSEWWNW